jgi:hypothetical protein
MLGEYKKHKMVSMQSKQGISWHGQPYSLIPLLRSIALFHHTLAWSTLFHQFLQLETKQEKVNEDPIMNENDRNSSKYGYPGRVLRMQYHSTLQYPIFFSAPSDEKTVIGLKVGGGRPLCGKLRM